MAKRSFSVATSTPTATADGANLVNDTYNGVLQGSDTVQQTMVSEVYLGGQASASAPTFMVLAMNDVVATVVVLGTQGRDAPLSPATAALAGPVEVGRSTTVAPQRDTLLHLLQLSFNAFGGIVRWLAAPGEEVGIVGDAVSLGSMSLSAFSGGSTGLISSHIIYETL
jgi:hypothetical protein